MGGMISRGLPRWKLKSVSWVLAEVYYNKGLQRPYTRTILQETMNKFFCPLSVFLKTKTHQLNFKDVIELNRNLWIKLLLASMNARQYNYCYMVLVQKTFHLFRLSVQLKFCINSQ